MIVGTTPLYDGDRIRMVEMPGDPDPIETGTEGIVRGETRGHNWVQVAVDWDSGRGLHLVGSRDTAGVWTGDRVELIERGTTTEGPLKGLEGRRVR